MTRMVRNAILVTGVLVAGTLAQTSVNINGTVRDQDGAPIESALVAIAWEDLHDFTDASGHYELVGVLPVVLSSQGRVVSLYRVDAGAMTLTLARASKVKVELYTMQGARLRVAFDGELAQGTHRLPLGTADAYTMLLLKTTVNGKERVTRYMPMTGGGFSSWPTDWTGAASVSMAKAAASVDTVRASAPGYTSASEAIGAYVGTVDLVLTMFERDSTATTGGTPGWEDGSYDRFAAYGMEQYFYGDETFNNEPLVQVLSAVSTNSVDAMLTFNPGFTDNTYGSTVVGWNNHPFRHVYGSDHIELQMVNGDGETVLHVRIDLLSECPDAVSGWCSQGVGGIDGAVLVGDPSYIISYSTSMDDNLNAIGCPQYTTDSPPTDSMYTPSAECPNWQYYASYRISVDPAIFGPSGYGGVFMTSVHASPSKVGTETVPVTEGPPPSTDPLSPDNPWRYFTPYTNTPVPTVPDTTDSIPITD